MSLFLKIHLYINSWERVQNIRNRSLDGEMLTDSLLFNGEKIKMRWAWVRFLRMSFVLPIRIRPSTYIIEPAGSGQSFFKKNGIMAMDGEGEGRFAHVETKGLHMQKST